MRAFHRSCSAHPRLAPSRRKTKKTPYQQTDRHAAGYIKHNDLHKWATMESSVARLLRVAVSISHTTVRGLHERLLRDFSFAGRLVSARDGAQAKRWRPLLATFEIDRVWIRAGGASQRLCRFAIHQRRSTTNRPSISMPVRFLFPRLVAAPEGCVCG
jgi:hypothetical protein